MGSLLKVALLLICLTQQTHCIDDLKFDEITGETFDGNQIEIGWIKVLSCTAAKSSTQFTYHYTNDAIKELSKSAISLKFAPFGSTANSQYHHYAVIAKPNSPPMFALNNYKSLSYTIDAEFRIIGNADLSHWVGTDQALQRLSNRQSKGGITPAFDVEIYHAFNNFDGLHIVLEGEKQCVWDWTGPYGPNIEIYFGYMHANNALASPDTTDITAKVLVDSKVECGNKEVESGFHIGDILLEARDVIDDICSSVPGQILIKALSVIPAATAGAEALCLSVSAANAICDLFNIESCATVDKQSSIVASCWSSEYFHYHGSSIKDAFKHYLSTESNITATYGVTNAVPNEKYNATEVCLDNCGNAGNNWIAGVYETDDNGEQNDIVSDVVEYLVNRGIASTDNAVGGVSSVDQSAYDGAQLTDVLRSNKGLLLHYDERGFHRDYGLYLCEFNVIDFDESDGSHGTQINLHLFILVWIVIMTIILSV